MSETKSPEPQSPAPQQAWNFCFTLSFDKFMDTYGFTLKITDYGESLLTRDHEHQSDLNDTGIVHRTVVILEDNEDQVWIAFFATPDCAKLFFIDKIVTYRKLIEQYGHILGGFEYVSLLVKTITYGSKSLTLQNRLLESTKDLKFFCAFKKELERITTIVIPIEMLLTLKTVLNTFYKNIAMLQDTMQTRLQNKTSKIEELTAAQLTQKAISEDWQRRFTFLTKIRANQDISMNELKAKFQEANKQIREQKNQIQDLQQRLRDGQQEKEALENQLKQQEDEVKKLKKIRRRLQLANTYLKNNRNRGTEGR